MKTIVALVLMSATVMAQSVDYNKIILPDHAQTSDFGEKLVQIAWRNNPNNDIIRRQVNIAGLEVKKSNAQWLDIVQFQSNLNQFTLDPGSDIQGRAPFYPKYNVHFGISLATFLTIPYTTKQNKEALIVAQSQVNAQKLQVRNAVLRAYNEFLMREKIYKIQSQLALDNETSHKLVEQKFKNGEITFESYSLSLTTFGSMSVAHLEAEKEYRNAKLDLEQLIGMKLEDVR